MSPFAHRNLFNIAAVLVGDIYLHRDVFTGQERGNATPPPAGCNEWAHTVIENGRSVVGLFRREQEHGRERWRRIK